MSALKVKVLRRISSLVQSIEEDEKSVNGLVELVDLLQVR